MHRVGIASACLASILVAVGSGCSAKTNVEDDRGADLQLDPLDLVGSRDLLTDGGQGKDADSGVNCQPLPSNLLQNSSFEAGLGSARNTGIPASSIANWDGCCDQGKGLTTTWTVATEPGRAYCGDNLVRIQSTLAQGDVLNQTRVITDGAGRDFTMAAWIRVESASGPVANSYIVLDAFDLTAKSILAESTRLGGNDTVYRQVVITGRFSQAGAPNVQIRLRTFGTITALADDLALTIR